MTDPLEAQTRRRAEQLRRIAGEEIRAHRERRGFLAAALDGSLATGALWPSSDLDFTVVPLPGMLDTEWVEWGQSEGIPWHKHLTYRRSLLDLMGEYPESFVHPAQGRFNSDGNWLLDGLAVMEIVEDPEGLLAEVKAFTAARRFAPEIWDGRREGFPKEMRRLLDLMRKALDGHDSQGVFSEAGEFVMVAGQLWLEKGHRIYSSKEQDRQLWEVAEELGYPEVHRLYRRVVGVDEERVKIAAPLIREIGAAAGRFLQAAHDLAPEGSAYRRDALLWKAWILHLSHRMSIAPEIGNPAHLYGQMERFRYEVGNRPRRYAEHYALAEVAGAEALTAQADELSRELARVEETLFDPGTAGDRAQSVVMAAEELLKVTERKI